MSKLFGSVDVDLDTLRRPTETNFVRFMKNGAVLAAITLGPGDTVVLPNVTGGRLVVDGTDLTPGDIVLAGNWGLAPVVTLGTGSNDSRGTVNIVPGAGVTGSRTWTLTFKDGAWVADPFALVSRKNGSANLAFPADVATTITTLTVTVTGVGTADVVDAYTYMVLG